MFTQETINVRCEGREIKYYPGELELLQQLLGLLPLCTQRRLEHLDVLAACHLWTFFVTCRGPPKCERMYRSDTSIRTELTYSGRGAAQPLTNERL